MTDKIRALDLTPPTDERIVAFLRDLLTRAEAGEFSFVSAVVACHDRSILSGYVAAKRSNFFQIVGAMEVQKQEFIARRTDLDCD